MSLKNFLLILAAVAIGSVVGLTLMVVAVVFALTAPARAHDGYETECCDNRHCALYPEDAVVRDGAFWVLRDGTRIHARLTRPSASIGKKGFHLCRWKEGESIPGNYHPTLTVHPKQKQIFFYVPDPDVF